MSSLAVLALVAAPLATADNPPAGAPAGAVVTARASATIVRGAAVRQSGPPPQEGPSVQITRTADGEVLVEFT
ncbi:hypothetical protein U4960_04330 [Altererythrobacter sp. H2]|uniref:hypothetical protein n=1 Tax=Altererythrobacter sp. H2 TaxID=3108391 RepID=UPI002B4BC1AB|nr:hypothetical protein [Altererythrobacter sp. H2]WRK96557.1 hypothetical protein U4960_04330 [Altererythrobacter sp. H2]